MVRQTLAERARMRLKEEMHVRDITQRDLADELTKRTGEKWTQSRIGKVLTGRVALHVDDLALVSDCIGVSVIEVLRDRGLEFYAECTPTEVRLLEWLRRRPQQARSLMQFADIIPFSDPPTVPLGTKKRAGRPLNSSKASDQFA